MNAIKGAGLGFRREMLDELLPSLPNEVDFWEVAPENWIPLGAVINNSLNKPQNKPFHYTWFIAFYRK